MYLLTTTNRAKIGYCERKLKEKGNRGVVHDFK